MGRSKLRYFREIQKIVDELNLLLDKELKNLENGRCGNDEKIQEIVRLIDDAISKQLEILGYVKNEKLS